MFCLGLIILEIFTGKSYFNDDEEAMEYYLKIFNKLNQSNKSADQEMNNNNEDSLVIPVRFFGAETETKIVKKLFSSSSKNRISTVEILQIYDELDNSKNYSINKELKLMTKLIKGKMNGEFEIPRFCLVIPTKSSNDFSIDGNVEILWNGTRVGFLFFLSLNLI